MAVSKRLRFEILRRDNHACRYCGRCAPDVPLTVDHVIPEALGGSDDPSNLVTACKDCNAGKSSMPVDSPLVDDVSADAVRWARAMKEVAQIREQEIEDRRELFSWFNTIWCEWHDSKGNTIPADGGYWPILKFLAAGLTRSELKDLVGVAMRANHIPPRDTWRYFCGCCWKRIRENTDMAAEILAAEDSQDG